MILAEAIQEQELKYKQSPSAYLHGLLNGLLYAKAIQEDKLNTEWYNMEKLYK